MKTAAEIAQEFSRGMDYHRDDLERAILRHLEHHLSKAWQEIAQMRSERDAERMRVIYTVRDIAGLELALKVQDATIPDKPRGSTFDGAGNLCREIAADIRARSNS